MSLDQQKKQMQVDQETIRERMSRIGHRIVVLSGKGGVGKSTVAVNLAVSLADKGYKVGLLDVDIHGPSVPHILGLTQHAPELAGAAGGRTLLRPVSVGPNLRVMSIGFLLEDHDSAVVWRGPMKHNMIKQFLRDVEWGPLDYLIVDSPPGTGDEPLAVIQLMGAPSAGVIVTTPQELAINDVRRSITFCNTLDLPILGIVENMSGFICPACGERTDIFKRDGGRSLAKRIGAPLLGSVPIDSRIADMSDLGRPYVDRYRTTEAASVFEEMTELILGIHGKDDSEKHGQTKDEKGMKSMKIAMPLAEGRLAQHFGHCEAFAILEVNPESRHIMGSETAIPPPHEPGVLPRWLAGKGVQTIIAGGMGQRAQDLFSQNNINVVVGAPSDTPENLVVAHLDGRLVSGKNLCDH